MNGMLDIFYISIFAATLFLSVIGVWFTAILPGLDHWNKRFFLCYFSVFILCCLSALGETLSAVFPVSRGVFSFILMLESLVLSLPLLLLAVFLPHCSGEEALKSRIMRAAAGLWAVYIVFLIVDPFIGVFMTVTPDNRYFRGPLYPVALLPLVAILILTLAGAIRRRKLLSRKVFISFLISVIPMTAAFLIQLFVDVFPLLDASYVLSGLSMYGLILSDQIEQDRRYQREIANQRAGIMVLQMRPHFIYNVMTSIYSLCGQDPQLARRVIMDFTDYLRKNFTAVSSSEPIPFSSELEHTRAYLAVEQALYEDSLFVEYDTPHTFFRVPPLTLQPVVENAVKHGRDPYAGPFHISVRTRKISGGSEITVADNGRGFDLSDTGEPGVALNNIRRRLEIMCGGTLTIAPNDGGGTVVTIMIPDAAASQS